jgi:hypothetical protein
MPTPNITYAKNDNSKVRSSDDGPTMCKRFQNGLVNFKWRYMLCCLTEKQEFGVVHRYTAHTE